MVSCCRHHTKLPRNSRTT